MNQNNNEVPSNRPKVKPIPDDLCKDIAGMLCHSYTSNARPLLLLSEEEFQQQLDLISEEREDSQEFKFYLRYNQDEVEKAR